jgi:2,3-bisphosphoglycerate-dependent phosphoglycerate mutase
VGARPQLRSLSLVRHAQSAGNLANDAALASGRHELDLAIRDMDVPLSALGEEQARSVGRWLADLEGRPAVIVSSPYRRALDTARLAIETSGCRAPLELDERLREREFGILDRLTKPGIEARHPEQAAARAFLGKMYHRPPGGESWADVAARVRAVLSDLRLDHADEDVVIVSHQAVIMLFRYVLEGLDEPTLLLIDKAEQVANTGVSTYAVEDGRLRLVHWNDTGHLPAAATTDASDVPVAPR